MVRLRASLCKGAHVRPRAVSHSTLQRRATSNVRSQSYLIRVMNSLARSLIFEDTACIDFTRRTATDRLNAAGSIANNFDYMSCLVVGSGAEEKQTQHVERALFDLLTSVPLGAILPRNTSTKQSLPTFACR